MPREWVERTQDLRYFNMCSSRRKGLIGMRKIGWYISNLYCFYDYCPFKLSADWERNTSNFQNVEGHKMYFSCEHLSNSNDGGMKMTDYCRESEILTVYHLGTHTSLPIPNTKRYRSLAREAVLRNSGLGACSIQQMEMGGAVAAGDIQEAWRRAKQLSRANLRYEKANLACERNPDKHSLKAVGI